MSADFERKILDQLAEHTDGVRKVALRHEVGVSGREQMESFREAFRRLLEAGQIVKRRRGMYVLPSSAKLVNGTLTVNPRGFGFVRPDGAAPGDEDVFIPPKGLHTGLSGDRVQVALEPEARERGQSGTVVRIIERGRSEVTGQLVDVHGRMFVRPLRRDLPETIPTDALAGDEVGGADHGDWVVATLAYPESPDQELKADVTRRIGGARDISADLDAIVAEYALPRPYTAADNEAAVHVAPLAIEREDLTALTVLTIDPEDAKDFDDALSCQPGPDADSAIVAVHIADVAAFVPPGSALDEGAAHRGFTSYLPGRTLPMLPKALASNRCSLREGQAREAHTVFLTVSRTSGEILGVRRCHSRIQVTKRLSFNDVELFMADGSCPDCPDAVISLLRDLCTLYKVMRRARGEREQFMELATPEVRVLCDEEAQRIDELVHVEQKESHALVEEFMLAANTAVAQEFARRRVAAIYRTHAEPLPRDMDEFRQWVRDSLSMKIGSFRDRSGINRFLRKLATSRFRDIAVFAFLRTMQRAAYTGTPAFHFGLGKELYCHFTSPIRRYPDLVVHQQLWALDCDDPPRTASVCCEIAGRCTEIEANVDEAFYAAVDRLKLRYVRQLEEQGADLAFEGLVARILPDRVLVYLAEFGLYGSVPMKAFGRGLFKSYGKAGNVAGPGGSKAYRCGDVIFVRVHRADVVKGSLELRPMHARW